MRERMGTIAAIGLGVLLTLACVVFAVVRSGGA
jgi:hypothetical protein